MTSLPDATINRGRVRFISTVMIGLWAIVIGRLFIVQCEQADELASYATRQQLTEVTVSARPADLVDRSGRLLATTIVSQSLFVDPQRLDVDDEFIANLAETLSIDADHLKERIAEHTDKRFLWVKRRVNDDEAAAVQLLDWPDSAYGFRDEFLRKYPQGHVASHVLGYRDIDGAGQGGVEQSLNHLIEGIPGKRKLVRDALGRIVEVSFDPDSEPKRFDAVQLTLDLTIQMFAEKALDEIVEEWKPTGACAIVMEPKSGDVLAMVSRPTYSLSDMSHVPSNAWRNQAISIIYEPGSTLKPFIVAEALQAGLIKRDEMFDCENGEYKMGPRVLHDHHRYGELSVTDVLVKSSNIGMAKIGERLKNRGLYNATLKFGFGRPTGIDLPGELSGILRPLKQWNGYSTGSIPMGHELAVTPLQLITAQAALANGGRLITPRILKGVQGERSDSARAFQISLEDPSLAEPATIVRPTVSAEVARWVIEEPMTQVVSRGTGRNAKIPGYSVFGKTGTAQKMDPETGGYSKTLHSSSFICGAPARNPRVIVLVVVDEPQSGSTHYGGTIAAPAAAKILSRSLMYLRVPPDQETRTAAR
ncbi:MAG: cell division protein FtsI (penicillin-binding protein 3) [Planctomycetaceae bacterium]